MKGAKGGNRDQIVSKKFHEMMEELMKREGIIEQNDSIDGIRKESDSSIEIEPKEESLETEINSPLLEKDEVVSLEIKHPDVEKKAKDKGEEIEKVEVKKRDEEIDDVKKEIIREHIASEQKVQSEETTETPEEIKEETDIVKDETEEIKDEVVEEEKEIDDISYQEMLILYQIERSIREDYYELRDLEYRIDIISIKEEQAVLKEDIDALQAELEELLKKFDLLKEKYDKWDIVESYDGKDKNYLRKIIDDYKDGYKTNVEIDDLINRIEETKKNIGIIETLIITEHKKDDIEEELEDKYEKFDIRDKEFEELETRVNDAEKIQIDIEKMNNNLESTLKELDAYLKDTVKITNEVDKRTERVFRVDRVVEAITMMATAASIPRSPLGNIVRASMMADAVHSLSNLYDNKEIITHKKTVSYNDYGKEILSNSYKLDAISQDITLALKEIISIRDSIEEELKDYIDLIPEYKELVGRLDQIEDQLIEQQYNVEKYQEQNKKQYNKNKEKKYIKEYEFREN